MAQSISEKASERLLFGREHEKLLFRPLLAPSGVNRRPVAGTGYHAVSEQSDDCDSH